MGVLYWQERGEDDFEIWKNSYIWDGRKELEGFTIMCRGESESACIHLTDCSDGLLIDVYPLVSEQSVKSIGMACIPYKILRRVLRALEQGDLDLTASEIRALPKPRGE